jgi:hypothetical protein
MAPSRRRLRIVLTVVALAAAGAARAEEVAYLMYVKGSEGPPATPMRVLWDVRDDANARITIDLGAKYEAALAKLGLQRVLKYDAKREQARFVVRDAGFTRFVQTVATSLVQALLTASVAPGAWAQRPEADVKDAADDHAGAATRPARGGGVALRHLSGPAKVRAAEGAGPHQGRPRLRRPAGGRGPGGGGTDGQALTRDTRLVVMPAKAGIQ